MRRLVFSCPQRFDGMTPVEGGRHCGACDCVVRDLREATEADVEALEAASGPVCVHGWFDSTGSPLTRAAAVALLAACGGAAEAPRPPEQPAAMWTPVDVDPEREAARLRDHLRRSGFEPAASSRAPGGPRPRAMTGLVAPFRAHAKIPPHPSTPQGSDEDDLP